MKRDQYLAAEMIMKVRLTFVKHVLTIYMYRARRTARHTHVRTTAAVVRVCASSLVPNVFVKCKPGGPTQRSTVLPERAGVDST